MTRDRSNSVESHPPLFISGLPRPESGPASGPAPHLPRPESGLLSGLGVSNLFPNPRVSVSRNRGEKSRIHNPKLPTPWNIYGGRSKGANPELFSTPPPKVASTHKALWRKPLPVPLPCRSWLASARLGGVPGSSLVFEVQGITP